MFRSRRTTRSHGTVMVAVRDHLTIDSTTRLLMVIILLLVGATSATADFTFGTPTNLGPTVNSSVGDGAPNVSPNGLELFFTSNRAGGYGGADIWVATRATTEDDWGTPRNLGPTVNSSASWDESPSISADGLTLFFDSARPGGSGAQDLWVTTRRTLSDPWEAPVNLGPTVNSPADDFDCFISADGLSLYFESNRPGGYGGSDIWVTTRASLADPWGEPTNLGSTVNSFDGEGDPSISADGLVLFFGDHPRPRPGGCGGTDIWMTTRATISDPWGEPVNLGPAVNTSANDHGPKISADGSTLYFFSTRPGGSGDFDLWQASITPVVDFNGDENVDLADLEMLIDAWGTGETLCDIGPMPWGDGIVDAADLKVLMSHWQQEVLPVSLLAYWKMDETADLIAHDSSGNYDATMMGNPLWLPEGGMIGGALLLDGLDDYVVTPYVRSPGEGSFSVFAWIKEGRPGQAIVSQVGGLNWLMTDVDNGTLTTQLRHLGRQAGLPLRSDVVITDGKWHHVGLTWEGVNRTLYVDDVEVAGDTQSNLDDVSTGLHLGCGADCEPGTFWSGLIDDVRIYNRVMRR